MNILGSGKNKKIVRKAPSLYYRPNVRIEKKNTFDWRFFWYFAKIILPILAIIYVFYWSPIFKIKEILVSGNSYVSTDRIISAVPQSANIFALDTDRLSDSIQGKIPEIDEIKIYKGIPDALKIIVTENQGALVWQSGINYYLISKSGVAFKDITADMASYAAIPKVVDTKAIPVTIPHKIVSQDFVAFVGQIYSNIKEEDNLDPDYFSIAETTVDVNLVTKNGLYLKFDSLRSASKQLDNLKLVLMEKRAEIAEYVDLRVSGWAYYK